MASNVNNIVSDERIVLHVGIWNPKFWVRRDGGGIQVLRSLDAGCLIGRAYLNEERCSTDRMSIVSVSSPRVLAPHHIYWHW
jgi:hypothetical protein